MRNIKKYEYWISFFWDSKLSELRREEINEWYSKLPEKNRKMVDDIIEDAHNEGRYDEAECRE